MKRCWISSDT